MEANVNVSNTYKMIRLWKGLGIAEISRQLEVAPSTVSRVENGLLAASPALRARYARKFPVDETYHDFVEAYRRTGV